MATSAVEAQAQAEDATDLDYMPGLIQGHGMLLALDASGRLVAHSANASMLGRLPQPGQQPGEQDLTPSVLSALRAGLAGSAAIPSCTVILAAGDPADLTLHWHGGLLLAEFEVRHPGLADEAALALRTQRALASIQSQPDIAALIETATREITAISGFDRVTAYRFLPDGSGQVIAEHQRDAAASSVGMRYQSFHFPEHTRALFARNPIRLVPDVRFPPVQLIPDRHPFTGEAVDLSLSLLRSIPREHCEYMGSLGVAGWMALAIVAQGELWGMFAGHNYSARPVDARVRESCQLLTRTVSLMVERLVAMRRTGQIARGQRLRSAIAARVRSDEYVLHALTSGSPSALDIVPACGLFAGRLEQVQCLGETPAPEDAAKVLDWLENVSSVRFATAHVAREVPELAAACTGFAGFLAIRFSPERHCWLVWFRREKVEILRWAGDPGSREIVVQDGSRHQARDVFAEWRQVVRGRSEEWDEPELYEAEELRLSLADISASRLQEVARAREVLLAMLGHDLRSPVQAIAMVGETLDARFAAVQKQIARISGRMGRLITHVLDMSRLQAGFTLVSEREPRDFGELLSDVINEARLARPRAPLLASFTSLGTVDVDADRITQVLVNLISNARSHGQPGKAVRIEAERTASEVIVRVINHGHPVSEDSLERLFAPFKQGSLDNAGNPRGLGLGLYIASTIVREHGGRLDLSCGDGLVTFAVVLPLKSARKAFAHRSVQAS